MISHGSLLTHTFTKLKSIRLFRMMALSKSGKSWQSRSSSQPWKACCPKRSLPWRCVCQWKAANVWMVLLATSMLFRATPLEEGLFGFVDDFFCQKKTAIRCKNWNPEVGLNCRERWWGICTIVTIDGATPMYCFIMAPGGIPRFASLHEVHVIPSPPRCGTNTHAAPPAEVFNMIFLCSHSWYISRRKFNECNPHAQTDIILMSFWVCAL